MGKRDLTPAELRTRLDYDADTGEFRWTITPLNPVRIRGRVAGTVAKRGYFVVTLLGYKHYAHRLAWLHVHGEWPATEIDHINGDKTDNRMANLRVVTKQENMLNQKRAHSRSASGILGASFKPGHGWSANLRAFGKTHRIGYFKTAEAAHAAYMETKRRVAPGIVA